MKIDQEKMMWAVVAGVAIWLLFVRKSEKFSAAGSCPVCGGAA